MRWAALLAPLLMAGLLSGQIRPVPRPSNASKRFAAGPFAVWLNPADWSTLPDENGFRIFRHKNGYDIRLHADPRAASNVDIKRAALAEFRATDPNAEELNSEAWTVGRHEVLAVESIHTEGQQLIRILGAYYGGPSGSLRVELRTVLHIVNQGRKIFQEFVAGLDFGEPGI